MLTSPGNRRDYQELKDPVNWIRAITVYGVLGALIVSSPLWLRYWIEYGVVTIVAFAFLPQLHELRFVLWLLGANPLRKKQQDKPGQNATSSTKDDEKYLCVLRHSQQLFPFSPDRDSSATFFPRDFDPTWGWALSEVLRQMEDQGTGHHEIGNDAKLQLPDGTLLHFGDHMCELLDSGAQPLPVMVDIVLSGESVSGGGIVSPHYGSGADPQWNQNGGIRGGADVWATLAANEDEDEAYEESDWTTKWYTSQDRLTHVTKRAVDSFGLSGVEMHLAIQLRQNPQWTPDPEEEVRYIRYTRHNEKRRRLQEEKSSSKNSCINDSSGDFNGVGGAGVEEPYGYDHDSLVAMDASAALTHFVGATEFRRRVGSTENVLEHPKEKVMPFLGTPVMGTRGRTESSDWNAFGKLWPPLVYGTDIMGHLVIMDRIRDIDVLGILQLFGVELALLHRSSFMDRMQIEKAAIARALDRAFAYQHVYLIDLEGFPAKYFSQDVIPHVRQIVLWAAECYPETLHRMYILNCPVVFRVIWRLIRSRIEPNTAAKIEVLGDDRREWHDMWRRHGLPTGQLPRSLGGGHEGRML
jgi:hypothetical protein